MDPRPRPLASLRRTNLLTMAVLLLVVRLGAAQVCGDCLVDGSVDVLDALRQAQLAVAILPVTPADLAACDVDWSGAVGIVDALLISQRAAGLARPLACDPNPQVTGIVVLTGGTAGTSRVPLAGGEVVGVDGGGFGGSFELRVDGAVIPSAVSPTPFRIEFTAPPVTSERSVDVEVTNLSTGLQVVVPGGLTYTSELDLSPFSGVFGAAEARHLYRRAAFGGSPTEITAATGVGLVATTTALVDYVNDPAVEQDAQAVFSGFLPPRPAVSFQHNKLYWLHLLLANPNPFQERFAWFLHDHFAVSEEGFEDDWRWWIYDYVNLCRRASLGGGDALRGGEPGLDHDWRRIVIEMTKSRAMLHWLNGVESTVGSPNENYARELWELFMLGEGRGYTEADIREAARALTGFHSFPGAALPAPSAWGMRYAPARHAPTAKTVFGVLGRFGYDDVAPFWETDGGPPGEPWNGTTDPLVLSDPADTDGGIVALTLRERPVEVSRHVCRKLATFFLYDDPSDELVEALAAPLRAPGVDQWRLRPVILRILGSEAMFSAHARRARIKDPVEFLIGLCRTTGVRLAVDDLGHATEVMQGLWAMDEQVLEPPDVSGYPNHEAWASAQGMLQRVNMLAVVIDALDTLPEVLALAPQPRASITAAGLVDHLAIVLDVELSASARQQCIDYVNTEPLPGGGGTLGVFDPLDDVELAAKVRGLLWALGQQTSHQEQ